jgi:hypothetical protein
VGVALLPNGSVSGGTRVGKDTSAT